MTAYRKADKTEYTVLAGYKVEDLKGKAAAEYKYDNLMDAYRRAKYVLSDAFPKVSELAEPFQFVQVYASNGNCIKEFYRE